MGRENEILRGILRAVYLVFLNISCYISKKILLEGKGKSDRVANKEQINANISYIIELMNRIRRQRRHVAFSFYDILTFRIWSTQCCGSGRLRVTFPDTEQIFYLLIWLRKLSLKKKIAVFYYDEVCTILSINCKCCAIIYQASVATRLSAGNLSVIMKIHFCH